MKIEQNTINRTVVNVTEDELVKSFKESYIDAIAESDREDLQSLTRAFAKDAEIINQQNYIRLFRDGSTMMILPSEAFTVIEDFFVAKKLVLEKHGPGTADLNELVILIHCEGSMVVTVQESDISY
jgi:hypothetical protein